MTGRYEKELRDTLNHLYSLCDSIDTTPVSIVSKGMTLREALHLDIICFLAYLSASDGKVSWREAEYFNTLVDLNFTPDQIIRLIKDNNLYSTDFENNVPLTLKIFAKADKFLESMGEKREPPMTWILAEFYKNLGKDFCMSDGVAENEGVDLAIYLKTMADYIKIESQPILKKSTVNENSLKAKYEILKKN